jgi:hypothetical protein
VEILKRSGIIFFEEDWMSGDAGDGIYTGKKIGTNTCAVLSSLCLTDL